MGASPTTGFAIGSNGGVTYNGSGKFYACPYNDQGGYNVYSQPAPNQSKCVEITLGSAGSCGQSAQSSPAPMPSMPAYSQMPAPSPSPQPMSPPPAQMTCPTPVTITWTAPPVTVTWTAPPSTVTAPAPPPMTVTAPCQNMPGPTVTVTAPAAPPMTVTAPAAPPVTVTAACDNKPAMTVTAPCPSMPAAQPSMPAAQPSMPATQPPSGSCPADLNGDYQYPHLIVPINSGSPNQAYGTSYNGKVDKSTCSIFNFDIPASYSGKQCSVIFLFPQQKDLQTSSYTTSGSGSCSFSQLSSPAMQSTCWSNVPSKKSDLGSMSIAPGNSYTIVSGDCAAGQTVSYEMCSSGDYSLDYFQDYNPSPIGMYVRSC